MGMRTIFFQMKAFDSDRFWGARRAFCRTDPLAPKRPFDALNYRGSLEGLVQKGDSPGVQSLSAKLVVRIGGDKDQRDGEAPRFQRSLQLHLRPLVWQRQRVGQPVRDSQEWLSYSALPLPARLGV